MSRERKGRLENKVAIVTGAGAGIGRATAMAFADEDAFVAVTDIDPAAAAQTMDLIRAQGGMACFLEQDAGDEARWAEVVSHVVDMQGRLDVLVNNAGIQISRPLPETTLDDWRHVFRINSESVFLGTRTAIEAMKHQRSGSIINVSSTYAMVADHLNAAYCASKASVRHFTKAAALHCSHNRLGIRVNSVHPGVIDTPLLQREIAEVTHNRGLAASDAVRAEWDQLCPLGIGAAADIAHGIVYLAADESCYVTGSELVIDGGHLIR
ncbi:MAG: SDR family oxidoreductase [Parvibaculaceae bacterium]|nr:SDR family oxidoreductase [Parvibaculaceae bacterium]